MRKLEIKDAGIMRVAVQQEIQRSSDARYDHRLHGVLLLCTGMSCHDVASLFGHSARTPDRLLQHPGGGRGGCGLS